MSMADSAERRAAPRVEMHSDAVVYLGGEQIPCRTLNIAVGGMALSSPVRRRLGSNIRVDFLLPNGHGWMSTGATIVRDQRYHGAFVWGIQFEDLDEQTEKMLGSFVDQELIV
jgi:c-di-GMP-binding flagellar brake protein YcgR